MKTLKDHIKRSISVSENELTHMVQLFQPMTLEKESHLIKAGQYCENYYFVETGSLRVYTMVDNLVVTNWFAFEGNFFTDLESYTYECQAKFNIQAIENCSILYISRSNMNLLLGQYPAWGELVRKTWEHAFLRLTQIVLSVQTISAKGRYEHLFNHRDFIQKTPAKDLVALLGNPDPSMSKK
ncbi:Crp/Fnr family transcriptional regulator [Longitalea arenae]|uniref:Crp/Fnr family transcriptional regulator n=1 Tax=Longitalea arenae TaxID=2812558 RepID=UPI001967D13F|nr:cyclic nucleotide-binding domain-containing protein [Longitalea arenae]